MAGLASADSGLWEAGSSRHVPSTAGSGVISARPVDCGKRGHLGTSRRLWGRVGISSLGGSGPAVAADRTPLWRGSDTTQTGRIACDTSITDPYLERSIRL